MPRTSPFSRHGDRSVGDPRRHRGVTAGVEEERRKQPERGAGDHEDPALVDVSARIAQSPK
jgi:hypothetical protein